MNSRQRRAREAILDAFPDHPYEGAPPVLEWPTEDEADDAASLEEAFRQHPWRDLPREVWDRQPLFRLHPEARRWVLPVHLLEGIDRLPEPPTAWALDVLLPPDDRSRFEREYDAYSRPTREAIQLYLEAVREVRTDSYSALVASDALAEYWADREPRIDVPAAAPASSASALRVLSCIRDAFADVPYPGEDKIAFSREAWECPELNRDFRGLRWPEVPRAVMTYNYSSLPIFSAAGFCAYLPAYLCCSVRYPDIVRAMTVYTLDPVDPAAEAHARSQQAGLSEAQRSAVRSFLEHVREVAGDTDLPQRAGHALETYWGDAGG